MDSDNMTASDSGFASERDDAGKPAPSTPDNARFGEVRPAHIRPGEAHRGAADAPQPAGPGNIRPYEPPTAPPSTSPSEDHVPDEPLHPTPDQHADAAVAPDAIPSPALDWTTEMERLRSRYPNATDGILFCIYKLQGNPDLSLKDFRDEAALHGISLSGRSVHSARVLLGWEKPATRKKKVRPTPVESRPHAPIAMGSERPRSTPVRRVPTGGGVDFASLEDQLIGTIQDIQERATTDSQRLRQGIERAIEVLQAALKGEA